MTEPSPEATVAGDAAAAAVEELHAREAVVDAAQSAEVEASIAADTAAVASEEAEIAVETSAAAAGAAVEAQQEAAAAADVGLAAHERLNTMADEMGQLRPMISEMYQDWRERKDAENAQPTVEEVPVNDRAAAENANKDGGTDGGQTSTTDSQTSGDKPSTTAGSTSQASGRSHGLRRRHR